MEIIFVTLYSYKKGNFWNERAGKPIGQYLQTKSLKSLLAIYLATVYLNTGKLIVYR